MRVEDMAVVTAEIVADMPRPATLGADMLAMSKLDTLFAAGVGSTMRAVRAGTRAMQGAHLPGIAAVTGEAAVTGGVITDIRTMDIPGTAWAIMDWVTVIRTTGMAITVTAPGGAMIHTTDIVPAGTILIGTGIRPT
jgi:hypothetical protein